jgi:hypothetical protein
MYYKEIGSTDIHMKYIWIINQSTSTTVFYRSYSELAIDQDLVSGLLSALNTFSEVELKSNGISSIDMAGLRWVYLNRDETSLLLIAADDKSSNSEVMRSRLEIIYKMFIDSFQIKNDTMTSGKLIKVNLFEPFKDTVDMLRQQWKQAEKAMGAAAMFDLLGIFQQIFNNFMQIVKVNFIGEKYDQLIDEIAQYCEKLKSSAVAEKYPELKNIEFDGNGWSVINLNPIMLDEDILTRFLFNLLQHMKDVLMLKLKKMGLLFAFSREFFPYLLSQYELLERLKISKELLQIFLS